MACRMGLLAAALAILTLTGAAKAAGGAGIVVDTDRSINCTSLKTIVADVCRDSKNDQEKAIAIYDFMVRAVWMDWHSHRPLEMKNISYKGKRQNLLVFANDPMKYITVYGNCGCGPQAGVHGALCKAAGLKFRHLNPGFGHVSGQVGWGGKWHWMDVWLPAYVLDAKGNVPSYDEIMADRKLFGNARKEGRAPENFMVNYNADVNSVMKAKNWKAGGEPYTQQYVENLCLRPGESCTWLWGNVGKWYNPAGPYLGNHLDRQLPSGPAAKFANDHVLKKAFPYWEPYKKMIPDGPHSQWNKTYYRYYGNAIFRHTPRMTKQGLADVGAKLKGLAVTGHGLALTKGHAGEAQMTFDLPYIIADTQIEGEAEIDLGGGISFCFSTDGGKTWLLGGEVKKSGKFRSIRIGKPNTYEFPAGSTSGRYKFALRIVFRSSFGRKPVVLKSLRATNTTMLNFYSRPWLEAGKNNVTVTASGAETLAETPLEITWRWVENWKATPAKKSFTHKVAKSGAKCVIEVGGKQRPKMESVVISCPVR